jgi:hypothetical protein
MCQPMCENTSCKKTHGSPKKTCLGTSFVDSVLEDVPQQEAEQEEEYMEDVPQQEAEQEEEYLATQQGATMQFCLVKLMSWTLLDLMLHRGLLGQ